MYGSFFKIKRSKLFTDGGKVALGDAGGLEGIGLEVALYQEFLFDFLCHGLFVC